MKLKPNAKYTFEQQSQALKLRSEGVPLKDVSVRTGVSTGTIRAWTLAAGVKLTHEQRSRNANRVLTPEQEVQVVSDRKSGMTRKELVAKYGLTEDGLKSLFKRNGIVLDMETRQVNAYQGKLEKNPNAMADMRKSLTPEVVARRSESIKARYAQDEELRKLKGKQVSDWWYGMSEDERTAHIAKRNDAFLNSEVVQEYIHRHTNGKSLPEYYAQFATERGGKMIGTYDGSTTKIEWQCENNHRWTASPSTIKNGHWCPWCYYQHSKAELEILEYVRNLYSDTQGGVVGLLKSPRLELDIWVPSLKKAIEYDGEYWHGFEPAKLRDARKDLEAAETGIKLLRIKEKDYKQSVDEVFKTILAFLES
jgi:transposase